MNDRTTPEDRAELIAEGKRRLAAYESAKPRSQEEVDAAVSWNVWQLANGAALLDEIDRLREIETECVMRRSVMKEMR